MNLTNRLKFATIAVFVTALAVSVALSQQTQTNCTLNGNSANCTSNSTPTFQQSVSTLHAGPHVTLAMFRPVVPSRAPDSGLAVTL